MSVPIKRVPSEIMTQHSVTSTDSTSSAIPLCMPLATAITLPTSSFTSRFVLESSKSAFNASTLPHWVTEFAEFADIFIAANDGVVELFQLVDVEWHNLGMLHQLEIIPDANVSLHVPVLMQKAIGRKLWREKMRIAIRAKHGVQHTNAQIPSNLTVLEAAPLTPKKQTSIVRPFWTE
ncbi:uncharacterized protein EI90DRAFT_3022227 [Cantharellus anzutake]|uniref:uncharacterized protein n=1 Tax=Cantharellus anzutake TaxID=1750568 RepID=UPI001903F250|nr:uncharacterized protein EI90DRAFT_3022227 [Cantharellus anzutake]KAF8314620.1 hypothetical protein EI90DRAFT_3022227 [Cantharellus anzutake]